MEGRKKYRNYHVKCVCTHDSVRLGIYVCKYKVYKNNEYQFSFVFSDFILRVLSRNANIDTGGLLESIRDEGFNLIYGLIDTGKKSKEKKGLKPEEFNAKDYELPEESKISDEEIQYEILNALYKIFKENPNSYKSEKFNEGDGFCKILRISKNDFLSNIEYLEQKKLVKAPAINIMSITAEGIDELKSKRYKYRIVDPFTSDIQTFVHERFNETNPDIVDSLARIKQQLIEKEKDFKWQQVAFGCRDIIQDFTDALYNPEYLPEGESPPKKSETKRKLKFILKHKLNNSKNTERELLEGLIEYLYKYFDCINELIQKGVHKDIEKSDAERCLLYTYLFVADVLRLTKL